MKIAGERSQLFLQRGVFRSGGVESGRSGFRFAADAARRGLWLNGLFLLMLGRLRESVEAPSEEKTESQKTSAPTTG
jgi:hypothetical protein